MCKSNSYTDIIRFANIIMIDQERKKIFWSNNYNIKKWNIKNAFDVLNDNGRYVNLNPVDKHDW